MMNREPDLFIGGRQNPYLIRWHLIPKNKLFNIYLHKFCRSDDDRALHDHPWMFNVSILLTGEYDEENPANPKEWPRDLSRKKLRRKRFIPYFRWGRSPHRVQLIECTPGDICDCGGSAFLCKKYYPNGEKPVWTIFITGPIVRRWGFYCPKGWVWSKLFLSNKGRTSEVGRGCE